MQGPHSPPNDGRSPPKLCLGGVFGGFVGGDLGGDFGRILISSDYWPSGELHTN